MAKIIPITEEQLIKAVNEEGLGAGHPYESEVCMQEGNEAYKKMQLPGTIGVTRSANDMHYLVYVVDENGKMGKFSTHNSLEECYGMALRRYREAAKAPGYVKPEGDSFAFGPVSSWRDKANDRYVDYRRQKIKEYKNMKKSKDKKSVGTKKHGEVDGIKYILETVQYGEKQGVKEPFKLNTLLIQYSDKGLREYRAIVALHARYGFDPAKPLANIYKDILTKAFGPMVSKLKVRMHPGGISLQFRTPVDSKFDVDPVLKPAVAEACSHAETFWLS